MPPVGVGRASIRGRCTCAERRLPQRRYAAPGPPAGWCAARAPPSFLRRRRGITDWWWPRPVAACGGGMPCWRGSEPGWLARCSLCPPACLPASGAALLPRAGCGCAPTTVGRRLNVVAFYLTSSSPQAGRDVRYFITHTRVGWSNQIAFPTPTGGRRTTPLSPTSTRTPIVPRLAPPPPTCWHACGVCTHCCSRCAPGCCLCVVLSATGAASLPGQPPTHPRNELLTSSSPAR